MNTKRERRYKTNITVLWLAIQSMLLVVPITKSYGASFSCDREWARSDGDGRSCEMERAREDTRPLKTKACSGKSCIYRLSFAGEKAAAGEPGKVGYKVTYWSGSGYTLIEGDIEVVDLGDVDPVRARLIDPQHRTTIVGNCGGTACGTFYEYVRGPLKGAVLDHVGKFYLLTLPK